MDAESLVSSNKLERLRLLDNCEGGKKQKENDVAKGIDSRVKSNRPMTRSFHSQLLKNDKINKIHAFTNLVGGPPVLDENVADPKTPLAQIIPLKLFTFKPKPDEEVKQDKFRNKKKEEEGKSRKKSCNLTSVITAPSKVVGKTKNSSRTHFPLLKSRGLRFRKLNRFYNNLLQAVCRLINKPKEQIVDIDAADIGNELAVVEYIEDIYNFYKLRESCPHVYMNSQPEIDESSRATLVNWLVDVHSKFDFSLETLYRTISIVDRFLAVKTVSRGELQLVGLSALLIASKYEEVWYPEISEFMDMSDGLYTHEQILEMEKTIFRKLGWNLAVPTPYVFLVRFIKASIPDQNLENMAHFLSEMGMTQYATIMYRPSMFAASAVLAARYTLNKNPAWNDTLKLHTGYSEEQLIDCARLMVRFHCLARNGKQPHVYTKYSNSERGAVALIPPATNLLPDLCLEFDSKKKVQ